jgi:hypothetical protein
MKVEGMFLPARRETRAGTMLDEGVTFMRNSITQLSNVTQ